MTYMTRPHSRTRTLARHITLREMLAIWRQRRTLAQLDESRLNDIGISRDEALQEAQRPVWDVPQGWAA